MRRIVRGFLLAFALLLIPAAAFAHPLGNFTINRYSRVEIGPDEARLRYVLDLAEIPTLQELRAASPTGAVDDASRQLLLDDKTRDLAAGARLTIDGVPVVWRVESATLDLIPGQADLETMRVALTLVAPTRASEGLRVEYRDTNYAGRIGWHEVVLRGEGGIGLRDSTAPAIGATNELLDYPEDPLQTPPDVSAGSAAVSLLGASSDRARGPSAARSIVSWTPVDRVPAELTGLVRDGAGNPLALLGALALAAALGAMHGLGPGHGKTLVAAYLIGSRGTARHAALLGLTVTLTHTLGIYALGVVTLVAAAFIVPETLYPVISLVSGLMVAAVGVSLVRARLFGASHHGHSHQLPPSLTLPRKGGGHQHGHPYHDHAHAHNRSEGHEELSPGLSAGGGRGTAGHAHYDDHHLHDHEHAHEHAHGHDRRNVDEHAHGPHTHTHEIPERARDALMPRSLVMLGISGGILPCPTALVLLLAAISFQNVPLGMLLVMAFSVGLAGILTTIGLLVVYGGRALGRLQLGAGLAASRPVRLLPALSAFAITLWGLAITAQAAMAFL
jgi:nickel/cobalt transporter (NicO) family protein